MRGSGGMAAKALRRVRRHYEVVHLVHAAAVLLARRVMGVRIVHVSVGGTLLYGNAHLPIVVVVHHYGGQQHYYGSRKKCRV